MNELPKTKPISVSEAKEKVKEASEAAEAFKEKLKKAEEDARNAKRELEHQKEELRKAKEAALPFDDFVSELEKYEEKMTEEFVSNKNRPNIFIRLDYVYDESSHYCYYQAFDNSYSYLWENRTFLEMNDFRLDKLEKAIVEDGTLIIIKSKRCCPRDFLKVINKLIALVIAFFYRENKEIISAAEKAKETFDGVLIKEFSYDENKKTKDTVLRILYEKTFDEPST